MGMILRKIFGPYAPSAMAGKASKRGCPNRGPWQAPGSQFVYPGYPQTTQGKWASYGLPGKRPFLLIPLLEIRKIQKVEV